MTGPNAAALRRLIPAFAVTTFLALAALAPSQSLGATNVAGYGYANNCGVKGYGTHDHGKLCPNRPFPGKGKGLTKATEPSGGGSTSTETSNTSTPDVDVETTSVPSSTDSSGTSSGDEDTQSSVNVHGHGKGHKKG